MDGSSGTMLGISEEARAYSTIHEGAIYLHLGESYRVRELDLAMRTAVVEPFSGDYYTQAKKETTTAIVEPLREELRLGLQLFFGRVVVTEQVVGYQKKSIQTQESIELVALDLPQTEFETEAIWFMPDARMLEGLEELPQLLGSLHAAEHTLIALLPLWAMCDRWDIGGLSTNLHFQTGGRRSSSTTGTPAASGSPSGGSRPSRAGSRTPRSCSKAARASGAVLRASRARSAAT